MDLYMKEQYLRMLPLSNFNQSDLLELHNAQREVSNLIWVSLPNVYVSKEVT